MEGQGKVLDYTNKDIEEGDQSCVRLKSGISRRQGETAILEPQIDKENYERAEKELKETYYSRCYKDIDNLSINNNQAEFDSTEDWSKLKERMSDLTLDGSVLKRIKSRGVDTRSVPQGACITCNFEIRIEGQDEPFDSSFIRGVPERFRLDCSQILPGLEILIKSMCVGETALAIIAPQYAYGSPGIPPRIPPMSEIMVVVQLINFTEDGQAQKLLRLPAPSRQEKSTEEIIEVAEKENKAGNQFFKDGEWALGIQHYDFGIKLLEERYKMDKGSKAVSSVLVRVYLNKSMCYLRLENGGNAVKVSKKALGLDPNCVKAHYRLGKAYILLEQFEEARESLLCASRLKPNDAEIKKEMQRLEELMLKQKEAEAAYCHNMFKDYEKKEKDLDQAVLDSLHYTLLQEFKDEPESPQLTLPAAFFIKDIDLLKKGCKYLGLNIRIISLEGQEEQKILITKKSN